MTNREWVSLLSIFASHEPDFIPCQQTVSDTALILCQAVSWIIFHLMTNRKWVTLLDFFARLSHESYFIPWPTVCEWHYLISLPGSLINRVSSHDEQYVSDTVWFLCQAVSSIMFHSMTKREWVTLLYFFARQSHQSCFISWPTGSEWHCFISLPGSLISHVLFHDQQHVSDTASFLCQAVSWIMSHSMTNREWVTLLHFFARQSHELCLIPWPTGSEWHCFTSLLGSLIFHPMTHREWVTLLHIFARQSHESCFIPWLTASEWYSFISW